MQTLAFGGKGLLWFTYWQPEAKGWGDAIINFDGTPTRQYDEIKRINADVQLFGKYLLPAKSVAVLSTGAIPGVPVRLAGAPVTIGVLLLAIRVAGAKAIEYLALVRPRTRDLIVGLVGIIIIIAATDAILYLTSRAIVSPFQVISYTSAAQEGWLLPYFFATVIMAPAGEEALFRGYLFRGFTRPDQTAWPAIVVISLLWTLPHLQYDWTGMSEIFVAGLFLG